MADFDPHSDELVSAVLDGEATAQEIARVNGDPALSARLEHFRAASAVTAAPVPPNEELRERHLRTALEAVPGTAVSGDDGAGPDADARPAVRAPARAGVTSLDAHRARRLPPTWIMGAAAALVLLGGIFAVGNGFGGNDDGGEATASDARTESADDGGEDAAQSGLAEADAPASLEADDQDSMTNQDLDEGGAAPSTSTAFGVTTGDISYTALGFPVLGSFTTTDELLAAVAEFHETGAIHESATAAFQELASSTGGDGLGGCAERPAAPSGVTSEPILTAVGLVDGSPYTVFAYEGFADGSNETVTDGSSLPFDASRSVVFDPTVCMVVQ